MSQIPGPLFSPWVLYNLATTGFSSLQLFLKNGLLCCLLVWQELAGLLSKVGANKWDFWSVQSALASRINFLLFCFSIYINVFIWIERSHVLFYLITYFVVVLRIEPRTSWNLAKPSALVLSFSINLFVLGGGYDSSQVILIFNFYAILTHPVIAHETCKEHHLWALFVYYFSFLGLEKEEE